MSTPLNNIYPKPYESWMSHLSESNKGKKINELLLPGTHDSGAYQLNLRYRINTSFSYTIFNLLGRICPCVRKILSSWVLTQDRTIYQQLEDGIRFLDLRITYRHSDQRFYVSHTYSCIPLEEALKDIKSFMNKHAEEALVISLSRDWTHRQGMENQEGNALLSSVSKELKSFLCNNPGNSRFGEDMTLKEMTRSGKRIVCYYDGPHTPTRAFDFIWNGSNIHSYWTETLSVEEKKECLLNSTKNLARIPKNNKDFNVLCFTLTPSAQDVRSDVFHRVTHPFEEGNNLENLAFKINQIMPSFLTENASLLKNVNVITSDFPNSDFVPNIIAVNDRIQRRTEAPTVENSSGFNSFWNYFRR